MNQKQLTNKSASIRAKFFCRINALSLEIKKPPYLAVITSAILL